MPIAVLITSNAKSKSFNSEEVVDSRACNSSEDMKVSLYVQSNMHLDKSLPPRNPTPRRRCKGGHWQPISTPRLEGSPPTPTPPLGRM